MRRGRFITIGLAALAAMAVSPALASAASVVDDTAADFGAGTTGANTVVVAPGSVQLAKVKKTENFDGTTLPAGYVATPWNSMSPGSEMVSGGTLTVDGQRVDAPRTYGPGQVLEFTATFGAAGFQHVGFGNTVDGVDQNTSTFAAGPWAMFSTGSSGTTLLARTNTGPGGTAVDTPTGVDLTIPAPHRYRIEWSATDVAFFVDDVKVVVAAPAVIAGPMRPAISDFSAGGADVKVDSLSLTLYANTGTFTSRVFDAGDARAVWGALTSSAGGTGGVTIQTRSGNTAAPDASWSAYQPLGAGGAIQSPTARYIQYQAVLTTADDRVTPSLDRVEMAYEVDSSAPSASIDGATVNGTAATVTFSSPATDVARFECSLDGGAFAACSSPATFSGLSGGSHSISVRAVDKVGNVGPAVSRTFSVAGGPSGGGPDTKAPKVRIAPGSVRVSRRGVVKLRITCPRDELRCFVSLKLKLAGKTVASKSLTIAGGKTATAKLQLRKSAFLKLVARGRLKVTAVAKARDAAGNRKTVQRKITLHF